MSYATQNTALNGPSNDYHLLPVTDQQMRYARAIAQQTALEIPVEAQRDRRAMSQWISAHKPHDPSPFANYPTGKQVAYAEHIARGKRRQIPQECFRDKHAMSLWIDHNK